MSVALVEQTVEIRSGEGYQVADVNFPKRTVTVVAMPYERETTINEPGRAYQEVVSRGAFDGIEKRTSKMPRVNRDHSWDKIAGKIEAFHPSRKEGLVTEVKMFTTPIGEETLTLCSEGGLDASAGFCLLVGPDGRVREDAETWERNGTVRRLNRLRLDHLAFVPNPAYPDAVVLDVRNTPATPQPRSGDATPNRDHVALIGLRAEYEALNRRWLRP